MILEILTTGLVATLIFILGFENGFSSVRALAKSQAEIRNKNEILENRINYLEDQLTLVLGGAGHEHDL